MELTIRQVNPEDLKRVTEIERLCFPEAEAATEESFRYRIRTFPESFYVAELNGDIIGMINGCTTNLEFICDELYEPDGGHDPKGKNQTVFGLAVHPDFQCQGIAEQLMLHLTAEARRAGRKHMVLTCKDRLVHYYEKFGYVNRGISQSTHGGAVWYDMVMELNPKAQNRILELQYSLLHVIEGLQEDEKTHPRKRDEPLDWEKIHMASCARLGYLMALSRQADPELAACACVVHDYGRILTGVQAGHAEAGFEPVKSFLHKTGLFNEEEIQILADAVRSHSRKSEIGTPVEEIVKDADVVDCYQYGAPFAREEQRKRYEAYMNREVK